MRFKALGFNRLVKKNLFAGEILREVTRSIAEISARGFEDLAVIFEDFSKFKLPCFF